MSNANDKLEVILRRNKEYSKTPPMLPRKTRVWAARTSDRIAGRLRNFSEKLSVDRQWPAALRGLALSRAAEIGDIDARDRLADKFDAVLTSRGEWRIQLDNPPLALDGYNLLMVHRIAPSQRYENALKAMANHFLNNCPRLGGCLPYSRDGKLLLVDTLGMLCPFLAAYGRDFDDPEATALAKTQLLDFISRNLDPDSRLPFHAYYQGGPYRLGAHAWGRGVGWYLIGLADTLVEITPAHSGFHELIAAFTEAAKTLQKFQRDNGNWGWIVVLPETRDDTSVASFCGYALARARRVDQISSQFDDVIARALAALIDASSIDGTITNSSGECRGLTQYSTAFGPQPWVQGTAAALVAELKKTRPEFSNQ